MNDVLAVRYFIVQSTGVIFVEEMKQHPPLPVKSDVDVRNLMRYLDTRNKPSRFIEGNSRLYVEPFRGRPEYLMDAEGNVRRGNEEYQITPRAFLDLVGLLDSYLINSGKK